MILQMLKIVNHVLNTREENVKDTIKLKSLLK